MLSVFDKKLERLVSGSLKSAIDAHGPVTPDLLASATKRVVAQLREYFKEYGRREVADETVIAILTEARETVQELKIKNGRLTKQVATLGDGLRLIRDGEYDEGSRRIASEHIIVARKVRKGREDVEVGSLAGDCDEGLEVQTL